MMKISALIGQDEFDFEIIPPIEGETAWKGIKINDDSFGKYIEFNVENGVISDLIISHDIITDKGIILERLIELLREYNESRQMGFESEASGNETILDEITPYDPELIRVRPMVLSAYQVNMDINRKTIDLNPDFQRNFVWDDTRKSRLIESMLLKIPLPAFYFAEEKNGNYQVVDGLQRLTVINKFLSNEFKLKNLEYLTDLDGRYYSVDPIKNITERQALYEPYGSRVERTQLNINVIEASSPLRVKYDIFFRINTGGRPLNHQEIRNCFATEAIRLVLKRMANNPIFQIATGYSINDTRMDAQELAMRFLGFKFYKSLYAGDMNSFLDVVLDKLMEISIAKLESAEIKYYNALESAYHLFGDYSFRKCLPVHIGPGIRRQLINKAMFIAWTIILSNSDKVLIKSKPENEFLNILATELEENDDLFNALTTGTSDKNNLELVFNEFQNLLNDYLIS